MTMIKALIVLHLFQINIITTTTATTVIIIVNKMCGSHFLWYNRQENTPFSDFVFVCFALKSWKKDHYVSQQTRKSVQRFPLLFRRKDQNLVKAYLIL